MSKPITVFLTEDVIKMLLSHGNLTCSQVLGSVVIKLDNKINPDKLSELCEWWKLRDRSF